MKPSGNIEKKHSAKELAEAYVLPSTATKAERKELLNAFKNFRKKAKDTQSPGEKLKEKFLQLKYLMQDYVSTENSNKV